jgi:hypothetical protein
MMQEPSTESLRPVVHAFKVKICYFEHLADGAAPAAVQDLSGLGFGRAEGVDGDELFVARAGLNGGEGGFGVKQPAAPMVTRRSVALPERRAGEEGNVLRQGNFFD